MSLKIVPNKTTGLAVGISTNNPDMGYVRIAQEILKINASGFLVKSKNSMLITGEVANLQEFVSMHPSGNLPGKICTTDVLESEVANTRFIGKFNKAISYEENIAKFAKAAGNDGPVLHVDGDVILRFSEYDNTGLNQDVKINHTNVDEVSTFQAAAKAKADAIKADPANLPM